MPGPSCVCVRMVSRTPAAPHPAVCGAMCAWGAPQRRRLPLTPPRCSAACRQDGVMGVMAKKYNAINAG